MKLTLVSLPGVLANIKQNLVFCFGGMYFYILHTIFSSLRWRAERQFFFYQALHHKGSRKNTILSSLQKDKQMPCYIDIQYSVFCTNCAALDISRLILLLNILNDSLLNAEFYIDLTRVFPCKRKKYVTNINKITDCVVRIQ